MQKRIWFKQQKPFDYLPLRVGLGILPESALEYENCWMAGLCKKIYTTRTRPLNGEYIVVEGNRFKSKPVLPEIRFRVEATCMLDIEKGLVCPVHNGKPDYESWACIEILEKSELSFPELDIGVKGTTYSQFKDIIRKLNTHTSKTAAYYVNLLEAV